MSNSSKNQRVVILILLALLFSAGLNFYQYKNHTTTVVSYDSRIDSMITVRVDLERELSTVEMELEKYRGISTGLDSLLNDANARLADQDKKIRSLLAKEKNAEKLSAEMKRELKELRKMRDEYLERIDQLITENNILKDQNEQLNKSVQDLSETKRNLENKVTVASELKAEYLKVNSYKKKSSGKFVESSIAKRTNKMEVCFTVLDNKIATTGDKILYIVITEPTGKVLSGFSKGEFTNADGEVVAASLTQKINYDGQKQNVCASYETDERILTAGNYVIDVYLEGKLIANTVYMLK